MSPKHTSPLHAPNRAPAMRDRRPTNPSLATTWREQRAIRDRNAAERVIHDSGSHVLSEIDADKLDEQLRRRSKKHQHATLPCHDQHCHGLIASPGQCNGACYRAQRAHRLNLLPQALDLLNDYETLHFVTLASPHWRRPVGQLHTVRPNALKQWLRRRLLRTQPSAIAVGGIEVSFNVELDNTTSWAPHVHMIVANASAKAIKEAFSTDRFIALRSKGEKPLHVVPVTDLGKQLGYSVKGHVVERVAYIGSHGRQTRKTNRLRASLLAEHDRWLAASNVADRLILIGVRWHPTDHRLRVH